MNMHTNTTRLAEFRHNVETLACHGASLPGDWTETVERWTAYVERTIEPTDDLAHAILAGADEDTIERLTLTALVHRSTSATTTAPLHDEIAGHVLAALRAAYKPTEGDVYACMAAAYTEVGTRFIKAVETIDPDTNPRDLLDATSAKRAAWAEVEPLAAELTDRLELLKSAAALAGVTMTTEAVLALATTPTKETDRRALWAAWEDTPTPSGKNTPRGGVLLNTPRGGRWTTLARTGVKMAAPASLDKHTPYRRPEPMQSAVIATGPRRAGRVQITWDTEAGETFESKRLEVINASRANSGLEKINAEQARKTAPKVTATL